MLNIKCQEGLRFLENIPDNSVDLILTDPPYITSRQSGMDKWVEHVKEQDRSGKSAKTESEWENYKTTDEWNAWFAASKIVDKEKQETQLSKMKADYLKYGSIYGKKYAVKTNYGDWDAEFTLEKMKMFTKHFYRVLQPGGTAIIFFDLWKITNLKEMLDENKFKQIRFVEWVKTNPQPLNSKVNYLTNCREIALLGIKKSKPTFNSKYDNAIYRFPLQGGKDRFHPTQKSLPLFEALIEKHSNEGDLVLDCFLGSGTTAVAALQTGRKFCGCEMDAEYFEKCEQRVLRVKKEVDNQQA